MAKFGLGSLLVMGMLVAVAPEADAASVSSTAVNPAIVAAETRVSLGITATGYGYRESFDNTSDEENGVLPGVSLGVSRLGPLFGLSNIYTGVVYNFSGGPLAYQGYLQGGAQRLTPYDATDHARFNSVEVRLGTAVPLMDSMAVIPFVAAGYQNWSRNISGAGGYGSFYRAALAGVGARLDYAVSDRLVLSATAEGLAVFAGHVSAPGLGFSADLGTSGEEAVRLGADWRLSNAWHVFAGLEMRHFNYAGSKLNNGYYEPPSSTFAARGEMGVAFGFR